MQREQKTADKKFRKQHFKLLLTLAIMVIFVFFIPHSYAASGPPAIINYQGRLANSNGALLGDSGTTFHFKFSIWDSATVDSGIQLWPSTDPSSVGLTVRQGVFNVNIGEDTAALNYNFNTNSDIYLQVEVSSSGNVGTFEKLSPRQRISSAVFTQVAKAVSGTGQSSFGTTTPIANAVLTIEATSTTATPLSMRAFAGQLADLLKIENSSLGHLFSINSSGGIFASSTLAVGTSDSSTFFIDNSGKVSIGTASTSRKLSVLDTNSAAQLRLSQNTSKYGEFYIDASGDIQISSTGGDIRMNNENLWICSNGGCEMDATPPSDRGNMIVETALIFDNKFKFKLKENIGATTTTIMLDSLGKEVLEFDEDGEGD